MKMNKEELCIIWVIIAAILFILFAIGISVYAVILDEQEDTYVHSGNFVDMRTEAHLIESSRTKSTEKRAEPIEIESTGGLIIDDKDS